MVEQRNRVRLKISVDERSKYKKSEHFFQHRSSVVTSTMTVLDTTINLYTGPITLRKFGNLKHRPEHQPWYRSSSGCMTDQYLFSPPSQLLYSESTAGIHNNVPIQRLRLDHERTLQTNKSMIHRVHLCFPSSCILLI